MMTCLSAMARVLNKSFLLPMLGIVILLAACNSEILERQAEQIRQQEEEIARQRKELEQLAAGQKVDDQKQQDCRRAFRDYFDKAQLSTNREQAISLYRDGLAICPDDDVAHYELGRALADAGRRDEAEKEFAAALKINPDFGDARRQLDAIRTNR
jgi:tetratricopeptide (TPR) repeat protein